MTEFQPNAENGFAVFEKLLGLVAVWPLQKRNPTFHLRVVVVVWLQVSIMIQSFSEVYFYQGDMNTKIFIYIFCANTLLANVRYFYMHKFKDIISENVNFVMEDWATIKDEASLQIMKSHDKTTKFLCRALVGTSLSACCLFLVRIVFTELILRPQVDENAPIELLLPTSFLSNDFLRKYYLWWVGYQYMQSMCICLSGPTTDTFVFKMVYHLCAQFKILNAEWEKLGTLDESADVAVLRAQRKNMVILMKRHQKLLDMGEKIERSFTQVFFTQLGINVITVCIIGIYLLVSLKGGDWMGMMVSVMCVNCITAQSFMFCFLGDYLLTESTEVSKAAYNGIWYNLDKESKKDLIFIMMKADNALCLTAGKFCNMSLQTFINILKTAFSYLSVLRIMLDTS